MTTNERRILTEMLKQGSISKGELIEHLDLSWATIVKLVNRLEAAGIVLRTGTAQRDLPVGKNSYVYSLSSTNPVAVGVDVEYETTHLVLTNLRGDTIGERIVQTQPGKTPRALSTFLAREIRSFLGECDPAAGSLAGVGIIIPAFIVNARSNIYTEVEELLRPEFGVPVHVDNVVRAYTLHTALQFTHPHSFIMVTVRTGIGCGIVSQGHLYRGDTGLSGEISHLKVESPGLPCRCGKSGCLETLVNEHILRHKYREVFGDSGETDDRRSLEDLFTKAHAEDPRARAILEEAAAHLSVGLAALLVTFDISHFYLSGHFGGSGKVLASLIRRNLNGLVDRRFVHKVMYLPLNDLGFVMGAAKLILNDYLEAPRHT